MKAYDEMARDVLKRRDEYAARRIRKRKITAGISAACGVCLVLLAGFGIWKSGALEQKPSQISKDSIVPGEKDTFDDGDKNQENSIVINNLGGDISSSIMQSDVGVFPEDFCEMSREELNAYYGTDVFPEIPFDLKEWKDSHYGVYRRGGGTGEVYYDISVINYSNGDFSRNVNIECGKGGLPESDTGSFYSLSERSVINGTEIAIGQDEKEYYFAEFIYKNTGFRIIAEGITQEELVSVLSSLTD